MDTVRLFTSTVREALTPPPLPPLHYLHLPSALLAR